jgi:hypothetical protein
MLLVTSSKDEDNAETRKRFFDSFKVKEWSKE